MIHVKFTSYVTVAYMKIFMEHLEINRIITFLRLSFPCTNAREVVTLSKQIEFLPVAEELALGHFDIPDGESASGPNRYVFHIISITSLNLILTLFVFHMRFWFLECSIENVIFGVNELKCRIIWLNNGMLCHSLGGAVIFISLKHFFALALD